MHIIVHVLTPLQSKHEWMSRYGLKTIFFQSVKFKNDSVTNAANDNCFIDERFLYNYRRFTNSRLNQSTLNKFFFGFTDFEYSLRKDIVRKIR